jgi:copper transport outer membrane protein MctB
MMDLRYHLASLMSIFLALAVGIVVGISLGSSERQAATIQNLQRDVAAIRAEDSRLKESNAELRRLLAARDGALNELLPLAIRGRLAGNRVALVLTGDAGALSAAVLKSLQLAGAEVAVTVRLPRAIGERAKSGGASPEPGSTTSAAHETPSEAETVAAAVTRALLQGRSDLLEIARARTPDLEVTGDLHAPVRRLLLLCPNDDREYQSQTAAGGGVETIVARAVRDAQALLVAAEAEDNRAASTADSEARPRESPSLLPALTGLGASTVDNIDTPAGQIAAILALAGARGSYGTGPGAARSVPALP